MYLKPSPKALCSSIASLLGTLALLATGPSAQAAAITFATPGNITGDSDVFNLGTGLYGYNWSNTNQTINGVTLTGLNVLANANISLAGVTTVNTTAFNTGSAPYSTLSAAYHAALNGAVYVDGTTAGTVTLNNLVAGRVYVTQFWVNDPRPIPGRQLTISSAGGNSQILKYSANDVAGSPGQYALGSFTANAANQAFTIVGSTTSGNGASTQINAVQLRDMTGVWSGETNGNWDAGTANFTGSQTYTQVAAVSNNVFFGDTSGTLAAITNSNITIQAGGVSVAGTVFLQNSAVAYTFTGADAQGITGTSALTKTGSGVATFNSNNSYTGITTLTGGTLAVATLANGSLPSGIGQSSNAAANLVFNGGALRYTGASTSTNRNFTIAAGSTGTFDVATAGSVLTLTGATGATTGGLTKAGAGTLIVNGANLYTGATTVNAGILRVGAANSIGNGSSVVVNSPGTLDLNGLALSFPSASGTGTITDLSAGAGTTTVTLNNQGGTNSGNLFTDGPSKIVAVSIANANANGVLGNVNNTFSGGLTLLNNATGTRMVPIGGAIGTPGNITSGPYGRGAITVGLAPTDKAGLYFSSGVTVMNDFVINTNLGTDRPGFRVDSGGVVLSGAIQAKATNFMISTNGTGAVTLSGPISSGAAATGLITDDTFGSAVSVTLANLGTPSSYTGNTVFTTKGTLILGASNQIPDGAGKGNLVLGGKFQLAGFSETINGLSGAGEVDGLNGTSSLTVGGNDATGAANTFTGAVKNTAGTLALTKTGSGTLTLSGALTYTGPTTVNQGNLAINSSLTGSVVTVNSGGTLNGIGTVGAATLNAGGTVEGGALGIGTLTLNSLSLAGAGNLGVNLLANYAAAPALSVTGALDFGSNNATVKVTSLLGIAFNTPYKVATYGSLANGTTANFVLGTLPARGVGSLNVGTAGEVNLTVTSTDSVKWTGTGSPNNTWDTTAQNWKLASNNAATAYLTADQVIFDDSAALAETVVNLSTNVSPSSVSFANGAKNYTFQGSFGITGPAAITKDGAGTVTMNTANSYAGTTTINQGVLNVRNANALGATTGGTTVNSGGALQIQGGVVLAAETLTLNGSGIANDGALRSVSGDNSLTGPVTIGGAGAVIQVDANSLTLTAAAPVTATAGLTKTGPGTLILAANNSIAGTTTISGGTLQVGSGGTTGVLGTGPVVNNASLVFFRSDASVEANASGAISGTGSVIYNGPVVAASAAGQFLADDNNSYGGGTTISNARVRPTQATSFGTGSVTINAGGTVYVPSAMTVANDFTVSGIGWAEPVGSLGTIRLNGGAVISGKVNMLTSSRLSVYGGSGTFAGVISGGPNLEIHGNGTGDVLSFSAENTYTGTTTITSSTLQIGTGGTTGSIGSTQAITNNGALTFNRSDTLTVANAINGTGVLNKIGTGTTKLTGASTYTGATNVTAGTLEIPTGGTVTTPSQLVVAGTVAVPASLTISGGTITATQTSDKTLYVAGPANSVGSFNISSGSLLLSGVNSSIMIGDSGTGTYNQTGGTVVINGGLDTWLGNNAGSSTFNISAGTFTQQNGTFRIGVRATSTVNLSSSADFNVPTVTFGHPSTGGATDTLNLDGGTLTATGIIRASGTPTFNFNGGILRASASNASFMTGLTAARVKAGGAIIDSGAFNIVVGQSITHDPALFTPDGGLTKRGSGTLTLSLPSDINGPTTVEAGTLVLNGSLSASPVTVKNTGSLRTANAVELTGLLTVESGGALFPGTTIGNLFASGGAVLKSGSSVNFDLNGTNQAQGLGVNDIVFVDGALTLDGTLNVTETTANSFLSAGLNSSWTLFTYSGTLFNNGLDLGTLPALGADLNFAVDLSTTPGEVHLTVVPEPASALTLLSGLGVLVGLRRRRSLRGA
jgi:fibronectin-binding autotransporter adhesin